MIMTIGLLNKRMQAIYSIEVKYPSACFLFYIYNSTTGKGFENIIATKAVCKYECIFRNMSTKYFIGDSQKVCC